MSQRKFNIEQNQQLALSKGIINMNQLKTAKSVIPSELERSY
jgi:hypothetical protein